MLMQRSMLVILILSLVGGFILFKVKYEVVSIEEQLASTEQQIAHERETIHILKAEWSHLNEPQRLQKLAEKYLDIGPVKTEQIASVTRKPQDIDDLIPGTPQPHLASMRGTE